MTRILALGDSHFGVRSREEQCLSVHDWFADLVHEVKPDLVLHSGDVFDAWSRPEDRIGVADVLTRIADVCPVVIAKGGGVHDRRDDAAIMSRLRTKHTVAVEQAAGIHCFAGCIVAAMSWPEPAWLAAQSGATGEDLDQRAREALRDVFRGLGAALRAGARPEKVVFVGHLLVDGSNVSNGQELVGLALNVGLADLALVGADAYVLGHVHMPQQWDIDGAPCLYTGSPYAKTWGEIEQKSVVLLEWRDGRFGVERIPTPSAPLVHLEAKWDGAMFEGLYPAEAEHEGAEVRFRYHVAADQREAAARAAEQFRNELLSFNVRSVKLEPVVAVEQRARVPELSAATTLQAQLDSYWRATGFEPGDRAESLIAKVAELEVSHA